MKPELDEPHAHEVGSTELRTAGSSEAIRGSADPPPRSLAGPPHCLSARAHTPPYGDCKVDSIGQVF
jgi:hypothetical protein